MSHRAWVCITLLEVRRSEKGRYCGWVGQEGGGGEGGGAGVFRDEVILMQPCVAEKAVTII